MMPDDILGPGMTSRIMGYVDENENNEIGCKLHLKDFGLE